MTRGVPHESAGAHVTGTALYTDDLGGRLANVLYAWPVVSPHAHARLTRLDPAPALGVPGVFKVLTAADVPGVNDTGPVIQDEPLLPRVGEEVSYHAQPVAWVLAEDEEAARLGAARVVAEYRELPAILSIEQAIERGSFHTETGTLERGDPDGALASAPHLIEGELYLGGQEHFYLETQASLAVPGEDGGVFVHAGTQHPSETQAIVAQVCALPRHAVTVQCLRMGGGFGGKESQANPLAAVAALGAVLTGRPVRARLTRALDFALTGKRHPFLGRYRAGFDASGQLLGLTLDLFSDGGWSLDLSDAIAWRAMFHADNAYLLPHARVTVRVCQTHKTSQTAFRGFGGPQGMLMIEEVMDRAARTLGLPPERVRGRNFYREGDSTHYGQQVKDAGRIARIWNELLSSSDFAARRAEVDAFNAASEYVRRGLAITPVKFGISFTATFYNQAGALVLIYRDGSVLVNHGGTEMGQGLHTKVAQIAARTLGAPLDLVKVSPTRSDKVPNTSATAASSGTDLNGAAVQDACARLRGRLAAVAAGLFDVGAPDIVFEDGLVFPLGGRERSVTFASLVERAYHQRVQLFADGFARTPGIYFDKARGRGEPFRYFAYGAAVSEVEVNAFSGEHRLLRVDVLHDCGDSINPLIDRGQIEGGFVQGLGWLTLEDLRWAEDGRLATGGAGTYKLPGLFEVPQAFHVALLSDAHEEHVVLGSKAVGEPPLMLAISAREAIKDAVASFGGGPVDLASPAIPEAVFFAIERARAPKSHDRPVAVTPDAKRPDVTAVPVGEQA